MLFNSHVFLFAFLPATLLVFFALGRRGRTQAALAWLTVASLFFYGWWNPFNLVLIAGSMVWNFGIGRYVSSQRLLPEAHRRLLVLGIAANLFLLGGYKYAGFVAENLNALCGTSFAIRDVVLPLGISFFTFQQISYLVDTYRGETGTHNFIHYCLFVTFFPHLIAGPLVHHKEMLPQFTRVSAFRPSRRNLQIGLTIFAIGLFKKAVIADGVAAYAAPVFAAADAGGVLSLPEAWCGAVAYTLQLYFDFSGYSDMAIGLARLFGIWLPLNFHSPYKAPNIIEFWRRWHITLSRFLRDYLYIPLGGNRKGTARRHFNLIITMLLGGLWHGAGWTFILWGGLHGMYLVMNHAWRGAMGRIVPGRVPSGWEQLLGQALTFASVVCAWVVFRCSSMAAAGSMLRSMFGCEGVVLPTLYRSWLDAMPGLTATLSATGVRFEPLRYFNGGPDLGTLLLLLGVVWLAPNTQQILERTRPALSPFPGEAWTGRRAWFHWRPTRLWALGVSALTVIAVLHLSRISEFLYFQF